MCIEWTGTHCQNEEVGGDRFLVRRSQGFETNVEDAVGEEKENMIFRSVVLRLRRSESKSVKFLGILISLCPEPRGCVPIRFGLFFLYHGTIRLVQGA